MSDEQTPAPEAGEEVVPEVKETEAAEAPESTEGQETQPAEQTPDGEDSEEVSKSKARRERRKAEMKRLKQAAKEAEAELEKTQERLAKAKELAQTNTPPKAEDFDDHDSYLVALGTYHAARQMSDRDTFQFETEAQEREAAAKAARDAAQQEIAQGWAAQVADAKSRYADFEAVAQAPDLPVTETMAEVIASSDLGADIAYHLGKHRDIAGQISQMSPIEQAVQIGRIEATLSLPKPNTQSQAPDPVTPVKARNTGSKDPSKMTMAEYKAWREGKSKA